MRPLISFGFGAATAAIIVLGALMVMGDGLRVRRSNRKVLGYTEVRADRLGDIPTDELTYLADQFHVLTVRMYTELCTRPTAELGATQLEAMLRNDAGGL